MVALITAPQVREFGHWAWRSRWFVPVAVVLLNLLIMLWLWGLNPSWTAMAWDLLIIVGLCVLYLIGVFVAAVIRGVRDGWSDR